MSPDVQNKRGPEPNPRSRSFAEHQVSQGERAQYGRVLSAARTGAGSRRAASYRQNCAAPPTRPIPIIQAIDAGVAEKPSARRGMSVAATKIALLNATCVKAPFSSTRFATSKARPPRSTLTREQERSPSKIGIPKCRLQGQHPRIRAGSPPIAATEYAHGEKAWPPEPPKSERGSRGSLPVQDRGFGSRDKRPSSRRASLRREAPGIPSGTDKNVLNEARSADRQCRKEDRGASYKNHRPDGKGRDHLFGQRVSQRKEH